MGLFVIVLLFVCCNCRPLGVVSSVWTALTLTMTVVEIVSKLSSLGVSYIELRQGSLAGYESGSANTPNASALRSLVAQFPTVSFSYAMSLSVDVVNETILGQGLNAVSAISNQLQNGVPLLRIVDLKTNNKNYNSSLFQQMANNLAQAASTAFGREIALGVENAPLSWNIFWPMMQSASSNFSSAPFVAFDAANICWVSDSGDLCPQVCVSFCGLQLIYFWFLADCAECCSPSEL